MKQEFIKIIKSTAIVVVGLLICDVLVGYIGSYTIDKLPDFGDKTAKDKYRLETVQADILVLGSSRANGNYVVSQLKDSINDYLEENYTIYNAGGEGQTANYSFCVAENVFSRKAPRIVILETRNFEFADGSNSNALGFFNPYYKRNSIVHDYIDRIGLYEKIKVQSNMYCFNYKILRFILSDNIISNPSDGYENTNQVMKLKEGKLYEHTKIRPVDHPNPYTIENLERVLKLCKENNTLFVIATSPQYRGIEKNEFLHRFTKENNIPYIDLYDVPRFNEDVSYWRDINHLNAQGANEYTKLFFSELKQYLRK